MLSTKIIKRRLQSIQSTRQLTKAMEMVSTVKMRHAVRAMMDNRPFAQKSWEILGKILTNLQGHPALNEHPLFQKKAVSKNKRTLIILMTDDKGLCGGFHSHLFHQLNQALKRKSFDSEQLDFINIGRKGETFLRRNNFNLVKNYPYRDFMTPNGHNNIVLPIVAYILENFQSGFYHHVYLLHTNYVNTFVQTAQIKPILPFSHHTLDQQLSDQTFDPDTHLLDNQAAQNDPHVMAKEAKVSSQASLQDYTLEPDPLTILNELIPFCLAAQLYQALLESNASAESARIVAMRNANTAADDIAAQLQLTYNQVRQSKITQDIAEISAGKAALED